MTAKTYKDGGQSIDWIKMKTEYVTDPDMSLRKLSQKYGVRYTTIAQKSRADDWFATKKKKLKEIESRAVSKAITKKVNALSKELAVADKAADVLLKAFEDADQWNRYIVNETVSDDNTSMSTSNEKVFQKIDTRALKDAVQALKLVEELKRSMLNIQRAEQINRERREERRLEMEEERLKIEQARANVATGDEDDFGIMILPEVLNE